MTGPIARLVFAALLLLAPTVAAAAALSGFSETNLVSDIPGLASVTDPNLKNPWGVAFSPTSPFWIADNGAGVSTLYNGAGAIQPLVVTIPPASGGTPPSTPTGLVFNDTTDFGGAHFLFATKDGVIAAWNSGTTATRQVDNSASGASYTGLTRIGGMLYAANFHSGTVDVFNGSFAQVSVSGGFVDPNLPSGFAPFNVQSIGGLLYVTYAKQGAGGSNLPGPGNGFVDVFDANGVLQKRLVSGGALNSPWGLALAPAGFGSIGNDLLVGNFGDGLINVFDDTTGALIGTLADLGGTPLLNDGLWSLTFGNGGNGGDPNSLYITAGLNDEADGLLARVDATTTVAVPEPATTALFAIGLARLSRSRRRKG